MARRRKEANMNVTKILIAILLLALPVLAARQIITVNAVKHHTNTVEGVGDFGLVSFIANGRNMKIQCSDGAVDLLVPTVTNWVSWSSTNVLGAKWTLYPNFAPDTFGGYDSLSNKLTAPPATYDGIFMPNEAVQLRLVNKKAGATGTVSIIVY